MISIRLNGWTNRHITWIFPCMSVRNEVCMYVYRALCMYANELFKVVNWPSGDLLSKDEIIPHYKTIKDKYKTQSKGKTWHSRNRDMNISDGSFIAIPAHRPHMITQLHVQYRSQDFPRVNLWFSWDLEIKTIDSIAIATSENPIVQLLYGSIVNFTLKVTERSNSDLWVTLTQKLRLPLWSPSQQTPLCQVILLYNE